MKFSEFLEKEGKPEERDRGEYLFHQGDKNRRIYLVQTGFLKAYYLSGDGKENTKSFVVGGETIGSLKGIFGEGGSSFSLVCLERSTLIGIDFDTLYEHSQRDGELANDMVDFLLNFAMRKETREFELLCLPAEERYKRLLKTMPDLFDRVTQNDIARFLGVTPVGLSRIKKRVLR